MTELVHIQTPIGPAKLKSTVVSLARAIGFDVCRVARPSPPDHFREFKQWLANGAAGEMGYMDRGAEKRSDPESLLPGARSMIVLAMNYWQGSEPAAKTAGAKEKGRIARYAWGDDYHEIIISKLKQIDELLRGFGGVQKCYVDTGPVLERDYAARAGVGWHGKSTMLLNERLGTWFFLAEILTTIDLPEDPPARDRCGKCTRCIAACPTGAITAPHRLDARRCISYLTIELKNSIPLELRPLIGDRIFGCDDCLEACPWNRFAQISNEVAFRRRETTSNSGLRDYLRLTESDFRSLFHNSPIRRIKRRGFLRNVCVALGNVGTKADLPALDRAATDADSLISEHARWAINQIKERESCKE